VIAATLLALAGAAQAASPDQLTTQGLGPVRLGMTVAQAQKALGTRLDVMGDTDPPDMCGYATRADGRRPNIRYFVIEGRIRDIQVSNISLLPIDAKPGPLVWSVRTEAGVGLGASKAALRRAYGRRLEDREPVMDGRLFVDTPDGKRGLAFAVDHYGRVTSMEAGQYPALSDYEGCL
jgi:hypothetical protein